MILSNAKTVCRNVLEMRKTTGNRLFGVITLARFDRNMFIGARLRAKAS